MILKNSPNIGGIILTNRSIFVTIDGTCGSGCIGAGGYTVLSFIANLFGGIVL